MALINKKSERKIVNLALQGGGTHGAFTWGVLDALLEDDRIEIEGISGTSAGALNAAVMATHLGTCGAEGAREALQDFWKAVSDANQFSPLQSTPWDKMMGIWDLEHSPTYMYFDLLSRLISPYQFNPMNIHPLRPIIETFIDFEILARTDAVELFISATAVQTGRVKVFRNNELSPSVLLASACLPFLFQAEQVNGEYYWDGGYSGNPVLYPLIDHCGCRDIMIVQINPIQREELPTTARDIINRVNEISFNSSLLQEIRAVALISKLVKSQDLPVGYKQILLHCIEADGEIKRLGASSKFNADWTFLCHLKDVGRQATINWLDKHFDALGTRSTLDLEGQFLLHRS